MSFLTYLHKVVSRENLTAAEAQTAMQLILDGETSTTVISAFLVAERMKGETPDELLGFARAIRSRAVTIRPGAPGEPLVDTCGTGGDGACTFNISTVAAFVTAGAGVKVAKHGNRSISSQCGSADILEALGVEIQLAPEAVCECIRETGIGFLFAPYLHPAMKHAQPARVELKMRTVFNLLGPLTNPAAATAQVLGAPSVRAAELMAEALAALGLPRGFVVHGLDGLDEITTTRETLMLEIRSGAIAHRTVTPEDFGLPVARPEDLKGDDRETNARIARSLLAGEAGPKRDVVLANASAALVAAGKAANFREGVSLAAQSIDSGAAARVLQRMAAWTTASRGRLAVSP
ncbi:MAG TPA: anthranilate phosphoribosyltransferase [Bryobacteraceae bacterium]|nr:anthranilate phosphoribosyltransferase [Bryobacteraceae bacterium]